MTKRKDASKPRRRYWTAGELEALRVLFPVRRTREVADFLKRSVSATNMMAATLGLKKCPEYLASPASGRLLRGQARSPATQFRPGSVPWNKGTGFIPGGRSIETRFKSGGRPHTTLPIGSLRITADGYLEQKYREAPGNNSQRWRGVHRLIWERERGPIPAGGVVVFRPGMRTTVFDEITLDRIELLTRRELMSRNSVQNLPPELRQVIQLRGALARQITKRTRSA